MKELPELREQIDRADERLLNAFAERMRAARDIAEYKRQNGLPVYDAARERAVMDRQAARVDAELADYVRALYGTLFEASRDYQRRLTEPNLVLVGMPGCGKSAVGRRVAKKLGRPLVDTDAELARQAGMSIPRIFRREGEAGFRARERELIARAARERGVVIATGGGSVLDERNREALRQNGFVVHILRDLDLLATRGRPLSTGRDALEALWRDRAPLYAACADAVAANDGTLALCAKRVLAAYQSAVRGAPLMAKP